MDVLRLLILAKNLSIMRVYFSFFLWQLYPSYSIMYSFWMQYLTPHTERCKSMATVIAKSSKTINKYLNSCPSYQLPKLPHVQFRILCIHLGQQNTFFIMCLITCFTIKHFLTPETLRSFPSCNLYRESHIFSNLLLLNLLMRIKNKISKNKIKQSHHMHQINI